MTSYTVESAWDATVQVNAQVRQLAEDKWNRTGHGGLFLHKPKSWSNGQCVGQRGSERKKREQQKAGERLLRNDVYTLQLQAGIEVHWEQTVQTEGMNCIEAPKIPPSSSPACSNSNATQCQNAANDCKYD